MLGRLAQEHWVHCTLSRIHQQHFGITTYRGSPACVDYHDLRGGSMDCSVCGSRGGPYVQGTL